MGKRHDMVRRCAQIRDLVQERKYVQALEMIDTLPLTEVESLEDLYLFADLYEKAERLNEKKEIFFIIYNRTHSRYILNRLLRLVIRMGNMDEARELFLAYEFAGEATLDTYELRYLLAKAQGDSRTTLINILEELKKEEYTEEWGYQLALLYEMEGMREECIQECRDLKLWFGEGRIVEKAMELMRRCEAPDWQPPKDVEIPEPEEPERTEFISYAAPTADITDLEEETVSAPYKNKKKEKPKKPAKKMIPEAEPEDRVQDELVENAAVGEDEGLEETVSEVRTSEVTMSKVTVKEAVVPEETVQERALPEESAQKESAQERTMREEPVSEDEMAGYTGGYVSEPVVVKRENALQGQAPMFDPDEELEDDPEDISARGVSYRTLKSTIAHLRRDGGEAHFVFAGGEERIVLAVAKRITKELHRRQPQMPMRKIAKIAADKLNQLELSEQVEKLSGTCMLVTNAPEMTEKTVKDLLAMMEENGDRVIVMLSGPFDEVDCFLAMYGELSEKLTYKIRM